MPSAGRRMECLNRNMPKGDGTAKLDRPQLLPLPSDPTSEAGTHADRSLWVPWCNHASLRRQAVAHLSGGRASDHSIRIPDRRRHRWGAHRRRLPTARGFRRVHDTGSGRGGLGAGERPAVPVVPARPSPISTNEPGSNIWTTNDPKPQAGQRPLRTFWDDNLKLLEDQINTGSPRLHFLSAHGSLFSAIVWLQSQIARLLVAKRCQTKNPSRSLYELWYDRDYQQLTVVVVYDGTRTGVARACCPVCFLGV